MMEVDFVCNEIISALNNLASWIAPEKVIGLILLFHWEENIL